jgi:hypothetical protein
MMRKYLKIACVFSVVTIFFFGCSRTPDLTKDEVYNILNEIIADDSLGLNRVCFKSDNISIKEEYGFTGPDRTFIKRQIRLFKDFKFESGKLKYFKRGENKFDLVQIDTSCQSEFGYVLSFPLISADRQRVVISNTEDCHCLLGGQGGKYLYIKKDGRWKMEKSFEVWISQVRFESLRLMIS